MDTIIFIIQNYAVLLLILAIMIFYALLGLYSMLSRKGQSFMLSFFPQWFRRDGSPFSAHEKIGVVLQAIMLSIVLYLIFGF